MFADLPPVPAAIAAGILFFLIVGRMFWDSFKELFIEFLVFIIPSVILAMITDDIDADERMWKIILLLLGSVATGVWVYFKLTP